MRVKVALSVVILSTLLCSEVAESQRLAGVEAAEDFCRMDISGKRLNAAGAKDIAQKLLLSEKPWEQPSDIVVVSDCSIPATAASSKDSSSLVLDYHLLARMDSSLLLTRVQAYYAGLPQVQSERLSLVLTDTHSELGSRGEPHQVKGPLEWRIRSYPSEPHVSVNAAMNYVRIMGYHAKDIRAKMNARKTLMDLQEMLAAPVMPPQFADPKTVVAQFLEQQMGGLALQSDTADQLSTFLVHPGSPQTSEIGVVRAYVVKKAAIAGKAATVTVDFGALGEIDSQFRFTSPSEHGTVLERDYKLLLDNKYAVPAPRSNPTSEFVGPSHWRIESAPPEQWVSVATAIKYVTQMRDSTRDPAIKANADKTLAILAHLR